MVEMSTKGPIDISVGHWCGQRPLVSLSCNGKKISLLVSNTGEEGRLQGPVFASKAGGGLLRQLSLHTENENRNYEKERPGRGRRGEGDGRKSQGAVGAGGTHSPGARQTTALAGRAGEPLEAFENRRDVQKQEAAGPAPGLSFQCPGSALPPPSPPHSSFLKGLSHPTAPARNC